MSKKFTLEIDLGNAAFDPEPGEEIGRLLRDVAGKVEDGYTSGPLYDYNGNKVGKFAIMEAK